MEGIQTILRKYKYKKCLYEEIKEFTRGKELTKKNILDFIDNLNVKEEIKDELKQITRLIIMETFYNAIITKFKTLCKIDIILVKFDCGVISPKPTVVALITLKYKASIYLSNFSFDLLL